MVSQDQEASRHHKGGRLTKLSATTSASRTHPPPDRLPHSKPIGLLCAVAAVPGALVPVFDNTASGAAIENTLTMAELRTERMRL